jgi:hypothetical protein
VHEQSGTYPDVSAPDAWATSGPAAASPVGRNRRSRTVWRDFRIATCSANATTRRCRTFGRLASIAIALFEQVEAVMNQHAAVKTFSHVVSRADFKTVDMPPASDKVPPVTPWM